MTRTKAWIIAAGVTATVVLLVLAAGASFGQFGLGPDGGARVQASDSQQTERREADTEDGGSEDWDDEDEEHEGDDDEHEGDDDHEDDAEHEDDDEHEDEDD